jgi:hypothetical protein
MPQGDQPTSEVSVTGTRTIETQLWPITFALGNNMLAQAFQPKVCQSMRVRTVPDLTYLTYGRVCGGPE